MGKICVDLGDDSEVLASTARMQDTVQRPVPTVHQVQCSCPAVGVDTVSSRVVGRLDAAPGVRGKGQVRRLPGEKAVGRVAPDRVAGDEVARTRREVALEVLLRLPVKVEDH